MNETRRDFIVAMLKAGVASAFLPGAGRVWRRRASGLVTPPLYELAISVNGAPIEKVFIPFDKQFKTLPDRNWFEAIFFRVSREQYAAQGPNWYQNTKFVSAKTGRLL
jgi:hypothetical protein